MNIANSSKNEQQLRMIIIDSREPECIKSLFPDTISKVSTLHTAGDYVIMYNDEVKCVIERKTWKDLSGSVISGRFHDQLNRLKEYRMKNPKCKIYYLIEGKNITTTSRCGKGLTSKALISAVDRLMYKHDMYVIRTVDMKSTVDRIINMHTTLTKLFDEETRNITPNLEADSVSDSAQNSDEEIESDAENLEFLELEELANSSDDEVKGGLSSLQKIPDINEQSLLLKMWLCVPCVTDNTYKVYRKNTSLIGLYMMATDNTLGVNKTTILEWFKKENVTTKPAYITKVLRGIKAKKHQVNIISQIKGVTKTTATSILEKHAFETLNFTVVNNMGWKRKLTNLKYIDLLNKVE